ncbi:MAG: DUF1934 domain-containing protein [Anaerovoracaceae bacterium]|nr:DUF1934 domain-containing protein [Bacillota bacterium]MEE0516957.1 DUF1934 domain-containing protein [Anaerovoracaceae bacterium]
MKDITLKITGKQSYDGIEEEQMEFITDGRFYVRGKTAFIIYDESEVSGMSGCTTTIRVDESSLKMKRTGAEGMGTVLYFEEGKRFSSVYDTPYGAMGIEVLTDYVKNELDTENGKGCINVEYQISMEGLAEGRNKITIEIM